MNSTPRRVENIVTDKGKVPVYATGIIDQPWDGYSDADHEVWHILYQRQRELLVGRASDEFLAAQDGDVFPRDRAAAASGLPLVAADQRDPRLATTFGTGELIRAALDAGLRKIIIGIGGSATNDGGVGMARALGVRFVGDNAQELREGGAALAGLRQIQLNGLDPRLSETEITVACDVDNPLCGPRGASAVFGPQKGATPEAVEELDTALSHFAACARVATGRDVAALPGAGAAGGLGAGLLFFTQAKLRPGVEIVLDAVGFADIVKGADFVITGEGRTDFQTAFGKAPVGVAKLAKQFGVPVFCLSGGLGEGADDVLAHGIDATLSVCDQPMTLDECMRAGGALIESGAARLCRVIQAVCGGR